LSAHSTVSQLPNTGKSQYNIGGWIVGTPELLIKKWRPLLETYLTAEIGPLYDPPISFKLIPVDFQANFTSPRLIDEGVIDLICTSIT
jgi:hypothetical protein